MTEAANPVAKGPVPQLFTYAVILDFEATCQSRGVPRPQEIIEFPSVLLDLDTLTVLDEFESFVKPEHHPRLSPFCTQLTSIRQGDVDGAPSFSEVFLAHQAWLEAHHLNESNAILVTSGNWDLNFALPDQCAATTPPVTFIPPLYRRWHNIKESFRLATGKRSAPGLPRMLQTLGLKPTGHHHRGIDDCRNITAMCRALVVSGVRLDVTDCLDPSRLARLENESNLVHELAPGVEAGSLDSGREAGQRDAARLDPKSKR
ncbi:MAG: hypothetical protein RJA70_2094 [Pseudomonadota bacterium]|jgi:inhibitor of KinA sporulation pathway (predicted exonuclease)